jgi:LDH2 family malate/lactate/ureidoglycolate dehydrogenase
MTEATLQLGEIHELVTDVMSAVGVSAQHAEAIADTVTFAERDDCKSHGLLRVPEYVATVREGSVCPDAEPVLTQLAPAVLQLDACNGFAPLALARGREPLTVRAKQQGIALLSMVHSRHDSALWLEVEALCEKGLVALACVTSASFVAPAGGNKPLFGTNPVAFGWPRKNHPPMIFDLATSVSSRGDIMLREMRGDPLPEGWAIDANGQATTNATEALAGAQLPFGDYKGAAFSLMVELLAGTLIGDLFSFEVSDKGKMANTIPARGECIIAIDPGSCVGEEARQQQLDHAETLFARILQQQGTRLPSDRRYAARKKALVEGVSVPVTLLDAIKGFL